MNNFYKGGRELAFSQREGRTSSRKEKPPRLSKILTNQAVGESVALPSTTVRQLTQPGSDQLRDRFAFCLAFAEAYPKNRRTVVEETNSFFTRIFDKLKTGCKRRPSDLTTTQAQPRNDLRITQQRPSLSTGYRQGSPKDDTRNTQEAANNDIRNVRLMYRECTVSVRGVYRKGTKEVLKRYWRATKDILNACTSGVDQRYSKSRRIVGVEAMKNKVTLSLTKLLCFLRKLLFLMALKNKAMPFMAASLCFMLFNLSNAWAQSAEPRTAEGQTEIKPLQIGDTIPEGVWNMPLQTVRYGGETKEIRLADYRGKVIILDYWATWCLGCILSMPKMHELAASLPNDVVLFPVTRQDESLIIKYLSTTSSKTIQSLGERFHTIVDGAHLADLIPHRTIPHIAIINPAGILEQSTKQHLLSKEVLLGIANSEKYDIPMYRGTLDNTILSPTFRDVKLRHPNYYSVVSGYMDGFDTSADEYADSTAGVRVGHYINASILKLFQYAVRPRGYDAMMPNRRIMLVPDPSKLDYFFIRKERFEREEFSRCYEYAVPLSWTKDRIRERMLEDLQHFTEYYAGTVDLEVLTLVIRKHAYTPVSPGSPTGEKQYVKNGELQGKISRPIEASLSGATHYVRNFPMRNLVYLLNSQKEDVLPFVIDKTGIGDALNLDLPNNLSDLNELKKMLAKQGLEVSVEKNRLNMFVLSDKPLDQLDLSESAIKLTKFGYVLKGGNTDE